MILVLTQGARHSLGSFFTHAADAERHHRAMIAEHGFRKILAIDVHQLGVGLVARYDSQPLFAAFGQRVT
nr:hypothetical protein [Caballeronia glebae]